MCFDDDARPPSPQVRPMAGASVEVERQHLTSRDGSSFAVVVARASGSPTEAGMIVLPDVRGLHRYYGELAMRFAEAGIDAVAIDYFGRTATDDDRTEPFPYMEHVGRVTYPTLSEDIEAAAGHLRASGVRRIFSVGFCFGGRLSLLTPTLPAVDVAGAIGFYGWPIGPGRGGVPAPADRAADNHAPVLALFGGADAGIPASAVAEYEAALQAAGAAHEIVTYPGAPHSFFDRRQAEFAEASADAWLRILHLIGLREG